MSKRTRIIVAAIVIALVAAFFGFRWWYLRDDAPDAVSPADAVAAALATDPPSSDPAATAVTVSTDGATGGTVAAAAGAATTGSGGIAGVWVIDPEFGTFDYVSATGSFVGFRVNEELRGIGATTAVGRTGDVTGSITIEGTTLTAAEFEVNMATITTNESMRDGRVRSALDTGNHPTATFTLTAPVELGAAAANGGPVTVAVTGDLTIRGITKSIDIEIVDAQLVTATDRIALTGSTEIVFSDFGVSVPSAPSVLSADDHGILELQFILERSA